MVQYLTVERRDLDGFDGLQQAVKGTHFDIVQLGRGKLNGSISHLGIGDLTLSVCSFDAGVCAQRAFHDDKILIGMLLDTSDRVTQWSFDMVPGDIVVIPPHSEHHAVHCGAAAYAVMRLDLSELPQVFGGDPWLSDPENWQDGSRHRANLDVSSMAAQELSVLAGHLSRQAGNLSEGAAELWKRTIVECMALPIRSSLPPDDCHPAPSAMKLVRLVLDHLETTGDRPLHISEICASLHLSRRSLHRAFQEVFGIGPVTFLRQKRLCTVYSALRASSTGATTVSEVAMQQGFVELGRFARDYRIMFGEYPSQTLAGMAGPPADFAARAKPKRHAISTYAH